MPWKIYPNGSRELVRPTKYEKHLMLYPSGGASARAVASLTSHPVQVVRSVVQQEDQSPGIQPDQPPPRRVLRRSSSDQ